MPMPRVRAPSVEIDAPSDGSRPSSPVKLGPKRRSPRSRSGSLDSCAPGSPVRRRGSGVRREAVRRLVAWVGVIGAAIGVAFFAGVLKSWRSGDGPTAVDDGFALDAAPHVWLRDELRELPAPADGAPLAAGSVVGGYRLTELAASAGTQRLPAPIPGARHFTPALPHPRDAPYPPEDSRVVLPETSYRWRFGGRLNRGAHGEVWRGAFPGPEEGRFPPYLQL